MILIVVAVLVALIGLGIGLWVEYSSSFYPNWKAYTFNGVFGLLIGAAFGFLFGAMISSEGSRATASEQEYITVEEYELVALATQQETEGSGGMLIFVGWGQVDETRKAYWTAKDADGIAQMYSEDAMNILVKESDGTPRYVVQTQTDDTRFWVPWDNSPERREFLEVPEGTLTANYEFQP